MSYVDIIQDVGMLFLAASHYFQCRVSQAMRTRLLRAKDEEIARLIEDGRVLRALVDRLSDKARAKGEP